VKVYPINEDQLSQLALLRGLAGLCFTVAAAAFGFSANLYKDLQIQGQIPTDILSYWSAIRDACFWTSIVLGIIGLIFLARGGLRLKKIKDSTKFES
jgi:hypothetical protein